MQANGQNGGGENIGDAHINTSFSFLILFYFLTSMQVLGALQKQWSR